MQLDPECAVRLGIVVFQPLGDRGHLRLRLRDPQSGLQLGKALDPSGPAILQLVFAARKQRLHRSRRPKLERVAHARAVESFGCYADNRVLHAVQQLCSAEDVRVSAIPLLPCLVGDHRDRMRIVPNLFFRPEAAAQKRMNTERIEIVAETTPPRATSA